MRPKPFHSILEPHFDFVLASRRKRQSWQEIADALTSQGIRVTKQAVHIFMKRRLKRRYALGMAPPAEPMQPARIAHAKEAPADLPPQTENTPTPNEFAFDPLTKPLKTQSKWTDLSHKPTQRKMTDL